MASSSITVSYACQEENALTLFLSFAFSGAYDSIGVNTLYLDKAASKSALVAKGVYMQNIYGYSSQSVAQKAGYFYVLFPRTLQALLLLGPCSKRLEYFYVCKVHILSTKLDRVILS